MAEELPEENSLRDQEVVEEPTTTTLPLDPVFGAIGGNIQIPHSQQFDAAFQDDNQKAVMEELSYYKTYKYYCKQQEMANELNLKMETMDLGPSQPPNLGLFGLQPLPLPSPANHPMASEVLVRKGGNDSNAVKDGVKFEYEEMTTEMGNIIPVNHDLLNQFEEGFDVNTPIPLAGGCFGSTHIIFQ